MPVCRRVSVAAGLVSRPYRRVVQMDSCPATRVVVGVVADLAAVAVARHLAATARQNHA